MPRPTNLTDNLSGGLQKALDHLAAWDGAEEEHPHGHPPPAAPGSEVEGEESSRKPWGQHNTRHPSAN